MAFSLTVTFSFSADAQSFTGTAGSSCTLTYDSTANDGSSSDASPTGCLKTVRAVKGNTNAASNWARTLTYVTMGVPSNATVTGITSPSMQYSLFNATSPGASGQTHGAVTLNDGVNTAFNLSAAVTGITTVDAQGTYHTSNGTGTTFNSVSASKSATITINNTLFNANTTGSSITFLQDKLTFTISYTLPDVGGGPSNAGIDRGLIGHWPLKEGAGARTYDTSGLFNTGILGGTTIPTWTTTERFGKAIKLNGLSQVDCGNIGDLTEADSFSATCWVKYSAATYVQFDPIMSKLATTGSQPGWEFYLDNSGGSVGGFKLIDTTGLNAGVTSTRAVTVTNWNFVACVCERTTQLVKLSINGLAFETASCATVLSPSNTVSFLIGLNFGSGQFATVSDVRYYYRRALALSEVQQIYASIY